MPANPIWKDGTAGMKNVGLLLETQVVACSEEMLELGKVWWPFTQAHISKSLQVRYFTLVAIKNYILNYILNSGGTRD